MDAGVWVALAAAVVALAFGLHRRLTDGRARAVQSEGEPHLVNRLGITPGQAATFVQFSSPVCAPCRTAHRLLSDVVADDDALAHVEVDAESHLDLVGELGIMRTPTVLLLDADGGVRHRFVGVPRRDEVRQALAGLALPAA